MELKMDFTDEQINRAAELYPRRVTGPMAGCKHPAAVLRFALAYGGPCGQLAANYVRSTHGACWNAMCNVLPADGWLRWYAGL
jgi:hypothetical protein